FLRREKGLLALSSGDASYRERIFVRNQTNDIIVSFEMVSQTWVIEDEGHPIVERLRSQGLLDRTSIDEFLSMLTEIATAESCRVSFEVDELFAAVRRQVGEPFRAPGDDSSEE